MEPLDPIDSTEPADPMDSNEPTDPRDAAEKADMAEYAEVTLAALRYDSTAPRDLLERQLVIIGQP
jgi:hypothetical protein